MCQPSTGTPHGPPAREHDEESAPVGRTPPRLPDKHLVDSRERPFAAHRTKDRVRLQVLQMMGPFLAPRRRVVAPDADGVKCTPGHLAHRRGLVFAEGAWDRNPAVDLEVVDEHQAKNLASYDS